SHALATKMTNHAIRTRCGSRDGTGNAGSTAATLRHDKASGNSERPSASPNVSRGNTLARPFSVKLIAKPTAQITAKLAHMRRAGRDAVPLRAGGFAPLRRLERRPARSSAIAPAA